MKTRIIIFVSGIFLMGLGVSIITKVDLGTSPISTVPLVLSYILSGSFGIWTIILGVVFILLQMVLLQTVNNRMLYLQLLVNPLLGIAIDIGMWLLQAYVPGLFIVRIILLVVGCFTLAFGIYLQIQAQLVMNAGEGIVKVLSDLMSKPFSTMKIWFDWSLVAIAALLGIIFLKMPLGIGIGTLMSAFLVGYFVKIILKWELADRIRILKVN